jgi:membrane-associated phospholipid phosphatase
MLLIRPAPPAALSAANGHKIIPYAVLVGVAAFAGGIVGLTSFHFGSGEVIPVCLLLAWILFSGLIAQRHGMTTVGRLLEAAALPSLVSMLFTLCLFELTAVSLPLADRWLAQSDEWLGFDFRSWLSFYQHYPAVLAPSAAVYNALTYQIFLLPMVLSIAGQHRAQWVLVNAWAVSLTLLALLYPLAPAAGPFVHYGIVPHDLPGAPNLFVWDQGQVITDIQAGLRRNVGAAAVGLVSIPSFHACGGALLMWASRRLVRLRLVLLPLNATMIGTAIVIGGHYLVDILAGLLLAGISIWAAERAVPHLIGPHSSQPSSA